MKRLIIALALSTITLTSYAGGVVSGGLSVPVNHNNSSYSAYNEIGYEWDSQDYRVTCAVGYTTLLVKGEENLFIHEDENTGSWHADEAGNLVWSNPDVYRGRVVSIPTYISVLKKVNRFNYGIGLGWNHLMFNECYKTAPGKEPDIDSEPYGFLEVGYDVGDNWGVSTRFTVCDLDIESANERIGTAEDLSDLNGFSFLVRYRF